MKLWKTKAGKEGQQRQKKGGKEYDGRNSQKEETMDGIMRKEVRDMNQ